MKNSWSVCWSCIKLMWGWNNFFWTIQMNCSEVWVFYCVMIFISCFLSVPLLYMTLSLLWKLSLLQSRNFIKDLMKLFSWLKSCVSRVRTTVSFNFKYFYRVCSWVKWLIRTVSFCSKEWRITCLQVFKLCLKKVFKFTQSVLLFISITLQLYRSVNTLCFKFRLNINLQQSKIA